MENNYFIDLNQVPNWARKTTVDRIEGDIDGLRCDGCGHTWKNRTDEPKTCPGCNATIMWDEERIEEPSVVNQADVSALSQPSLCEECGEEIDTSGADVQDSTESDEGNKTLGDLLRDGDE